MTKPRSFIHKYRFILVLLGLAIIALVFYWIMFDQPLPAPMITPETGKISPRGLIMLEFDRRIDPAWVEQQLIIESEISLATHWEKEILVIEPQESLCDQCSISITLNANQSKVTPFAYQASLRQEEVAFLDLTDGQIYRTQSDTNSFLPLTRVPGEIREIAAAADGSAIIYSVLSDQQYTIHQVDRDGKNHALRYDCGENICENITVSAANDILAFIETTIQPTRSMVQLLDIKTGETQTIYARDGALRTALIWSPDDTAIALFDQLSDETVIIDLTDGSQTAYPREGVDLGAWTPDGKRIYLMHTHQELATTYAHICALDLEQGEFGPFQEGEALDTGQFSPPIMQHNGVLLTYARQSTTRENGKQLWWMNTQTKQVKQITDEKSYTHAHYLWNLADTQLLYQRIDITNSNATPEVWVWHVETNQFEQVAHSAALPVWLP